MIHIGSRYRTQFWAVSTANALQIVFFVFLGLPGVVFSQPSPDPGAAPLTLSAALNKTAATHPSLEAASLEVAKAGAAVRVAQTAFLPRADLYAQWNRASRNNLFGMVLNMPYHSAISGPPLETNDLASVWGSLAGILVSWEPFDFGLRKGKVAEAETRVRKAQAEQELANLELQVAAADSFLNLLAAGEAIRAADEAVARAEVLEATIGALAKAELRPTADWERAKAERSVAEMQRIRAQEAAAIARTSLGRLMDEALDTAAIDAGAMAAIPPPLEWETGGSEHPAEARQRAASNEVGAKLKTLERSYVPKITLGSTAYGRGSGARPDFTLRGGAAGLYPEIFNWGVGVSATFAALDIFSLREQKQEILQAQKAEEARLRQLRQDLAEARRKAQLQVNAARAIAAQTPVQLQAAKAALQQSMARYKAGLGNVIDVVDTQRLLAQAELENAMARLAIWRALLGLARAQGSLQPFVAMAAK